MIDLNTRLAELDNEATTARVYAESVALARRLLFEASYIEDGRGREIGIASDHARLDANGSQDRVRLTGPVVVRLQSAVANVLRDEAERLLVEARKP